ncbi:MAG: NYN domain-containing protein [Thermoguttaceae bacterium]|jgi:predicted RNA-binding protein with PIN domain
MSIIIDGYNLLYMAGILGEGRGPRGLEMSRLALLNFLAESLAPGDIAKTTVVFDAKDAPWGAKNILEHRGITVQFASRWPDADCLIEELIRLDSAPKRLTVVSSDHRLQRAARHRKAKAVDSDVWYNELVQKRLARRKTESTAPERPAVPLLAEDVAYWVRQFGGQSELEQWINQELSAGDESARKTKQEDTSQKPREEDALKDNQTLDSENPFPPGYAEDVEEEET